MLVSIWENQGSWFSWNSSPILCFSLCSQVCVLGNSQPASLLQALQEVLPVVFTLFCFTKQNASHLRYSCSRTFQRLCVPEPPIGRQKLERQHVNQRKNRAVGHSSHALGQKSWKRSFRKGSRHAQQPRLQGLDCCVPCRRLLLSGGLDDIILLDGWCHLSGRESDTCVPSPEPPVRRFCCGSWATPPRLEPWRFCSSCRACGGHRVRRQPPSTSRRAVRGGPGCVPERASGRTLAFHPSFRLDFSVFL